MKTMTFAGAIEDCLSIMMGKDERIFLIGEDLHTIRLNLFSRFGEERVKSTPISESAFVGASITAAMAGLRPIAEVMLVDFLTVAMDALINHAAKTNFFSGGKWQVPLVIRTACGGGYGDGGQHEQCLWGLFAHIPGLVICAPSNPSDAGRLMMTAVYHPEPVVYLEHKLLADYWLAYMGTGGRKTVSFDVPEAGARGLVPEEWHPLPIGQSKILQDGSDITIVSIGVSVHYCMQAAKILEKEGISSTVIDLRYIWPLDKDTIISSVKKTGRLVVVDEDYKHFGLSGEIAAIMLESGIGNMAFSRVCTENTIPYSHQLELSTLPSTNKIYQTCRQLL